MSPRESNPARLGCRVSGEKAIIDATEAARSFGQSQRLGSDQLAHLCVVIEELVANLYDHGGVTALDEVQVDLAVEPEGIRVVMVDPGTPFDPWKAPRNEAAIAEGGGVGLDIVKAWANYVSYAPSPGNNRLEFLLPVSWES